MNPAPQENIYREQSYQKLRESLIEYNNFIITKLPYISKGGKYSFYLRELSQKLSKLLDEDINQLYQDCLVLNGITGYQTLNDTRVGFLDFYHLLYEVAQDTDISNIPKNLHFFAEEMFVNLGCGKDIPYLIKSELKEPIPSTYELCREVSNKNLIHLTKTRAYLKNTKLHIICLSPTVINNPLDWVLMGHEIAHILEKEPLQIVQQKYPQIRPLDYLEPDMVAPLHKAYSVDAAAAAVEFEPRWCLELACDIIATLSFGPVYAHRLVDNFLKPVEMIADTHPPWKMRLKYISEELDYLGWKADAIKIRKKIADVKLPPTFNEDFQPVFWKEILDKIRKTMDDKTLLYRNSPAKRKIIHLVGKRLQKTEPCYSIEGTGVDPFDILNAAQSLDRELLSNYDFREFLVDMIRLTATRRMYNSLKGEAAKFQPDT